MKLSEVSIRRPVLATVMSLTIVLFGAIAFLRTPVREYPNIDPPIVSITTVYRGAASNVIEAEITGLSEQYERSGLTGLADIINERVERDAERRSVYLLADAIGRPLAGNVPYWPSTLDTVTEEWVDFIRRDERGNDIRLALLVHMLLPSVSVHPTSGTQSQPVNTRRRNLRPCLALASMPPAIG